MQVLLIEIQLDLFVHALRLDKDWQALHSESSRISNKSVFNIFTFISDLLINKFDNYLVNINNAHQVEYEDTEGKNEIRIYENLL